MSMMVLKARTFLVVAVLLGMASFGRAQQSYEQIQRSKLFNALDTFGFPEFAEGQFIKITAVSKYWDPENRLTNTMFGFLIKSDASGFSARLFNLSVFRFEVAKRDRSPRAVDATYEAADFVAWAKSIRPSTIIPSLSNVPMPELAASRACAARGLPDLSAKLFRQLESADTLSSVQDQITFAWDELRLAALNQILRNIVDRHVPRSQPLQCLIALNKCFEEIQKPDEYTLGTDDKDFRMDAVLTLKRMISDDENHSRLHSDLTKDTSLDSRIAELIFELRDENVNPTVSPPFEIFQNDPAFSNGAADNLIKIGLPAVPQLIATLNDRSFTRNIFTSMITVNSKDGNKSKIVRVQDMALSILERIAHRKLDRDSAPYPYDGNLPPSVIDRANAWWADYSKHRNINLDRLQTSQSEPYNLPGILDGL